LGVFGIETQIKNGLSLVHMLATARKNGITLCGIGNSHSAYLPKPGRIAKGSPTLPMTMARGTVAANPDPNESDFIWESAIRAGPPF
jgi:hypothetical protein